MAPSTVKKHLRILTEVDGRFVEKRERHDDAGRQTSNEYRLVLTSDEGRVHEITPGGHEINPRGSSRWTDEGPADGPEGSKNEGSNKKNAESGSADAPESAFVDDAWQVYLEELGGDRRKPTLTETRRQKIAKLYREQLSGSDSPVADFRSILWAVKASDHHMSERAYQMPESFLRNPERRERWTLKALDGGTGECGTGPSSRREALAPFGGDGGE